MKYLNKVLAKKLPKLQDSDLDNKAFFEHPASIPVDFALAIHAVLHNTAKADDWELIDEYRGKDKDVVSWFRQILKANGMVRIDQEVAWFTRELNMSMS